MSLLLNEFSMTTFKHIKIKVNNTHIILIFKIIINLEELNYLFTICQLVVGSSTRPGLVYGSSPEPTQLKSKCYADP